MIERDEIEHQAQKLDVHIPNVERDYVFGWFLKAIYENPFLSERLIFKGGNCMRKAYYPGTRFSSDLDFSVQSAIDAERFLIEMNSACEEAYFMCGVQFDTEQNRFAADRLLDNERRSYKGRIYFSDFYGEKKEVLISVRLDVTEFDRIYLPVQKRKLLHPYSDAEACAIELPCMALEELIANKLKCLIQRRHSFDLYDLVYATFIDRTFDIDRTSVLNTFLRKTIFEPSPGSAKAILLGLPMDFFSSAWARYVSPSGGRFSFEKAVEGLKSTVEAIFEGISDHTWGHQPFFPAEYRNLILDAGRTKRTMLIRYGGHDRVIEPYSLAYKRPQSGPASEYFYAWDRSGGSSKPGIKTFLHHKIEKLEVTENEFEPRFQIELSKAGESARNEYFGQPFSKSNRSSRGTTGRMSLVGARSRAYSDYMYKVECPYCGKTFRRKRPDMTLNPHKDEYGYQCRGLHGYLV